MKITKKQMDILEGNFEIYENGNSIGLRRFTNGGVDMYIDIDVNDDVIIQLENYLNDFDIDEEIDVYRQDKMYREHFTIRESVNDFEEWINFIQTIINVLKLVKEV